MDVVAGVNTRQTSSNCSSRNSTARLGAIFRKRPLNLNDLEAAFMYLLLNITLIIPVLPAAPEYHYNATSQLPRHF